MPPTGNRRLDSLTDEVAELHPLLALLLPKLPSVTKVEYHHGPHEMGADFVLAVQHPVFGTTEYVGVIAKIGRIAQDHGDLSRQIEECDVPRLFQGGKQQVHLTEIWVITTKHITQGAQRKIQSRYSTRKISFIDGLHLEKLIDEYVPTAWSNLPFALGEYLHSIRTRLQEDDKRFSLIPTAGQAVYVKQDLFHLPDPEYRRKRKGRPPRRLALDEVGNQRHTYIEGGIGSGKSKLVRRLAGDRADPSVYATAKRLPLVVSYNDLVETYDGKIDTFLERIVPPNVRTVADGEFIIYVDAFDERRIDPAEQSRTLVDLFEQATESNKVRLVVTSRHLRGLESTSSLPSYVARCELRHLSMERIVEFLSKLCTNLSSSGRVIEDLKKSSLFKNLPRSPISAILLARLLNENSQDIPSNMTELYSKYMEQILGRWDVEKGLQSQKEYQALDQLMMTLARYTIDDQRPSMSVAEAKQVFAEYLDARNLELDVDQLFDQMVERSEIMVLNTVSMTVAFKHRTFAEYFYAKAFERGTLNIDQRVFDFYWINVFFFYLGLRKDCPKEIEAILAMAPSTELQAWIRTINLSNYLLAAYTTPYEVIVRGVESAVVGAAELYEKIAREGSDGPLGGLSKMHLLYFLQRVVRHGYAFSFFERALEEVALRIDDDGTLAVSTKAYALFFLNVAVIDLVPDSDFDFLLKRYVKELPLEVQLALTHEGPTVRRTMLLKKQDRYLRRVVKTNASLQSYIDKLYDEPINKLVSQDNERERKSISGGTEE